MTALAYGSSSTAACTAELQCQGTSTKQWPCIVSVYAHDLPAPRVAERRTARFAAVHLQTAATLKELQPVVPEFTALKEQTTDETHASPQGLAVSRTSL